MNERTNQSIDENVVEHVDVDPNGWVSVALRLPPRSSLLLALTLRNRVHRRSRQPGQSERLRASVRDFRIRFRERRRRRRRRRRRTFFCIVGGRWARQPKQKCREPPRG